MTEAHTTPLLTTALHHFALWPEQHNFVLRPELQSIHFIKSFLVLDAEKKESKTSDRRREEVDRDKESKRESRSYVSRICFVEMIISIVLKLIS